MADQAEGAPRKQATSTEEWDPCPHLKPWRWKKGQSGNPKGRGKGSGSPLTSLKRIPQDEWDKVVDDYFAQGRRLMAASDPADVAVGLKIVKECLDRIDGTPKKAPEDQGEQRTEFHFHNTSATAREEREALVAELRKAGFEDAAKLAEKGLERRKMPEDLTIKLRLGDAELLLRPKEQKALADALWGARLEDLVVQKMRDVWAEGADTEAPEGLTGERRR